MFFMMKQFINGHALKALIKPVDRPDKSLAVGDDERHSDVPILIFTEQHLKQPLPEIDTRNLKYEDTQLDGVGASLSLDDFSTDNFYIGNPYGGV